MINFKAITKNYTKEKWRAQSRQILFRTMEKTNNNVYKNPCALGDFW
jgi:hypothetical protein